LICQINYWGFGRDLKLAKNINSNGKLKVFLRRVSTENQSLEMQVATDKKYRDALDEDEYIEVNELGISANKVKLKDREKMLEVISIIGQGKVDTIYVYDRSRLTRNFYEYLEMVDLFITHDVKVIFTSADSSYPQFNSNYLIEGFNGILIEEEGKSIARRVADAHRKLPPRKFGYDTHKDDQGKKSYTLQTEHKNNIFQLFEKARGIANTTEFIQLVSTFSSLMKKEPTDIVRILTDPFYSGCEKISTYLNSLSYVEPVISKEVFLEVQEIIEPFVEKLQQNISGRSDENILLPKCGICKNSMQYRKNKIGESGIYTCSNKHKKISISVDDYNDMLLKCSSMVFENLNEEEIEKKAIQLINDLLDNLGNELEAVNRKIEYIEAQIAAMPSEKFLSRQYEKVELKQLMEEKQKRKELREQLLLCENYQNKVKYLVSKVKIKDCLKNEELINLVSLIIKDCFVNESTLAFNLYFNEYLDNEQLERMIAI
jgi:site-specific DNA recombinase